MPKPSTAQIAIKLGYPSVRDPGYGQWSSNFRRNWLIQQHPALIDGPKALKNSDRMVDWETGLSQMYTDYPAEWNLAKFADVADRRDHAEQFLIAQSKSARSERDAARRAAQRVGPAPQVGAAAPGVPVPPGVPADLVVVAPQVGVAPEGVPVAHQDQRALPDPAAHPDPAAQAAAQALAAQAAAQALAALQAVQGHADPLGGQVEAAPQGVQGQPAPAPEGTLGVPVAQSPPILPIAAVITTASGNPGTASSPTTSSAPLTTMNRTPNTPRTPRRPQTTRGPQTTRSSRSGRSPLSVRGRFNTRKRARGDDEDEGPESPSGPRAKRQRQVDMPELRFSSFNVTFRGPNSVQDDPNNPQVPNRSRVHSTSYRSVHQFPHLVRWARARTPLLQGERMMLKTNIIIRNDEYLDLFAVAQGDRVERVISDQGSWDAAVMMAQGNRPNEDAFAGLFVEAISARADYNHLVEEEIGPDYTGEDERGPGSNNRPRNTGRGNNGEGPSRPSRRSGELMSQGGGGTTGAGDNRGVGGSRQDDDSDGDMYGPPGR